MGAGARPGAGAGLLEGYGALRHGIGAYRLRVDMVAVRGRDATEYLQGQLSQDVAPLAVGASAPALLLEPDGKLTALVRATRTSDETWVLDTDAGYGELVAARLERFKLRTKVEIEPIDWPCIALRGEQVASVWASGSGPAWGPGRPPFALAVEWNGTSGVDLLGPRAEEVVPAVATWCDASTWESLRVEAGIPKMGAELDSRTIAAEAGLVERTVSFTKGCYTGQELVARLDARGSRVARRLVGVVAGGLDAVAGGAGAVAGGAGAVAAAPASAASTVAIEMIVGASLWTPVGEKPAGEKIVGRCTSAAWCPGLGLGGAVGALAYLHRSVEVPAELVWAADEYASAADRRPATAHALPLVQ